MSIYFAVNTDSSAPIRIVNFGIEPNSEMAHWGPCRRRSQILHYVSKGRGYFNGMPVSANQGFYISPEGVYEYHSSEEEPWQYFWLMFDGTEAEKLVLSVIHPDDNGVFNFGFADKLAKLYDGMKPLIAMLNHYEALSAFYTIIGMHQRESNLKGVNGENPLVRSAKSYIETNYASGCTVADTARAMHLSDRYLYNLFVKHTGTTPKQYINNCRITAARALLSSSDLAIGKVAEAVGFKDQSQFSRFFVFHEKISPSDYRKNSRNSDDKSGGRT